MKHTFCAQKQNKNNDFIQQFLLFPVILLRYFCCRHSAALPGFTLLPFWALKSAMTLLAMCGSDTFRISLKIARFPKMNEGLTGVERHEGE